MSGADSVPMGTQVRIVNPPNFLKHKTRMLPGSADDMLARAERMIAALQSEFAASTQIRMERVAEICRGKWMVRASREDAVRELRRIAHDLKGEAGTFGYDLITEIADLFGGYLRETPITAQRAQAIASYVDALQAVWTQRIQGDGGTTGRALLDGLIQLNEKAQAGVPPHEQ